jgi:hypothetical protein
MRSVGKFNIFNKYDSFEMNMFGVIITKNCIKPTDNIVNEMLIYSLNHNKKLFDEFDVEIYGSFNSNRKERAMDIDVRIKLDNPFKESQLDYLEPLIQTQIDISFNKFQILLDIGMYDFNINLPTNGQNYLEAMQILGPIEEEVLHPSTDSIRFNDTEYRFNNAYYYKKYIFSKRWNLSDKTNAQILDNQYTMCTKIKSVDDLKELYK